MRIRYFPDTDTVYIELADQASSSSEALGDNVIVDFDDHDRPVALTLEHFSQISRSQAIETGLPVIRSGEARFQPA